MAKFVKVGETLTYANTADGATAITAGSPVLVGNIYGIAEAPIAINATGALAIEGVFAFTSSAAITQGAMVYLDSDGKVTTSGTHALGVAMTAASASGKEVFVKINACVAGSFLGVHAVGTNGQVLKTNSAATAAEWGTDAT